ncbi:MAG: NAD(P)-dependent oxidoreductase [Dehalococcoidia bacterium]
MKSEKLDSIDRRLLNLLQREIPLRREPFSAIANVLGISEQETIERVRRLKSTRILRTVSPIFNAQRLGYASTLVAVSVPYDSIEEAARAVNALPGVSHNYQRKHHYNLWFTLTLPENVDRGEVLQALSVEIEPEAIMDLPTLRRFKARAFFDMEGRGLPREDKEPEEREAAALTVSDWAVIVELQRDLPVVSRPFEVMARHAGFSEDEFLSICRHLKQNGVIKRYNAAVRHGKAGFTANAMVCWQVPPELVEKAGRKMSAIDEVSHCYERVNHDKWQYNLYTMIHAKTHRECRDIIKKIAEGTGIKQYEVLPTTREFKKERVKYRPFAAHQLPKHYYPISLDIDGKRCVVLGGGEVALRKVNTLLEHDAIVQVISPELCAGLEDLFASDKIIAAKRPYADGDLAGAFVIIAATDDADVNRRAAAEAEKLGVLVNVVDVPELSNFIVPSHLRRGDLSIAVSTGGASPALARRIRERLEAEFGDEYAALLALAGRARSELRRGGADVTGDDWRNALDIDALLALIREGKTDEAGRRLKESLERREGNERG